MSDQRTTAQNDLLQPACRDLSRGLTWDGRRLSQEQWRWLITAAILNQITVRGIEGGVVVLARSSKELSVEQASDAIITAFSIGDHPESYGLTGQKRVTWCDKIRQARGITDEELAA